MAMAEALKQWIPLVLQDTDCFYSSEDIRAGQRWGTEIQAWLAETDFGILCVTPENMPAPWLNFEAGALSKKLNDESRVVPVTLGFSPSRLDDPLKQFNGVEATSAGIHKLVKSLADAAKSKVDVDLTFNKWWPDLDAKISAIPASDDQVAPPEPPNAQELLAEIHGMVSGIARDLRRGSARLAAVGDVSLGGGAAERRYVAHLNSLNKRIHDSNPLMDDQEYAEFLAMKYRDLDVRAEADADAATRWAAEAEVDMARDALNENGDV